MSKRNDEAVNSLPINIIEICKRLRQEGWLSACDGNVSVRKDSEHILITPQGRPKAFLKEEELALMDKEGKSLHNVASSESLMHLAIYKHCAQAKAVVHAHPPISIAWSIAYPHLKELPANSLSELILAVGKIPIVPYARPGTSAMASVLLPYLPECKVLILAHHGALTWGDSLEEAYMGMERLEHTARILMYARTLGALHELPPDEIEYLKAKRRTFGERIL